ncbi:glycosyltransferase [Cohnella boryungensis]|uniref:Glycosyltransferase n=1 Tax=Cohnella boryungensis TaxID=768479 RepID=A0ABV8SAP5_9BACL
MSKLALVMITLNEEAKIGRCIESAAPYVDEIVVADTGSTDRTREIALELGAKVFTYVWENDFSAARNYAISKSSADWILVMDADEWIEALDVSGVSEFIQKTGGVGRIEIKSIFKDSDIQHTASDYISRLFPRSLRYKGRIHEQLNTSLPRYNVPILVGHDGYFSQRKSDRNVPLLLLELQDHPDDPYYLYQLAKEYSGLDNGAESRNYFSKAYAALQGMERFAPNVVTEYIYLLMKLKDYEAVLGILQREHAWLRRFPDYHFACGVFYLDLVLSNPAQYMEYLPRIERSYRLCLEVGETELYDSVKGTGSYAALYNLGNYYEVLGKAEQAIQCYRNSAAMGYSKAGQRLIEMNEE